MRNVTDQEKLDKLDKIQAQNRARAKKFLKKKLASGKKKQISGLISMDAYAEICKRRDMARESGDPLTMGDIISQAIMNSIAIGTTNIEVMQGPVLVVYKDLNATSIKIARSIIYKTIEDAEAGISDWESDNWEVIHGPVSI